MERRTLLKTVLVTFILTLVLVITVLAFDAKHFHEYRLKCENLGGVLARIDRDNGIVCLDKKAIILRYP